MKTKKERYAAIEKLRFERKLRNGEYLSFTEQAFYENYKEPLRAVKRGFGYYGVVATNNERTHIQCHVCGYFFKSLSGHTKTHKLSVQEYKDKFQLLKKTALVGEGVRELRVEIYKNRTDLYKMEQHKIFDQFNKDVKNGKRKIGGKNRTTWALERRNKEGLCPDQLLEKIKEAVIDIGHTPSAKEFRNRSGRYTSAIIATFGSWNNAIVLAKLKPNPSGGVQKYTDIELIQYQRQFYKEHNRVATTSDFSRGYMPPQTVYINRFGSLNEARYQAGLPRLIPLGGRRFVEECLEGAMN